MKHSTDHLSGVYEIPIKDYNGEILYYIGMTNRKFKDTLKEYMAHIRQTWIVNNGVSSFTLHL